MAQDTNGHNNSRRSTSGSLLTAVPLSPDAKKAVEFARKGSQMVKVRSKLSKNWRHFFLDEEGLVLKYRGSRKFSSIRKMLTQNSTSQEFCAINLSDIKEIREGALSDRFDAVYDREDLPKLVDRCFVLLIGERFETMDFVARTAEERQLWIEALNYHREKILHNKELNPRAVRNAYLKYTFEKADKNNNGTLELKEVMRLMNDANATVDENYAKQLCLRAKIRTASAEDPNLNPLAEGQGVSFKQLDLNIDEFITFVEDLMRRRNIDSLFTKYDHNKGYMTTSDLQTFFKDNHNDELTATDCAEIIKKCEVVPELKEKNYLAKEGFDTMFNTAHLDIRKSSCQKVYQDMTQPLCHYFIDSSHNTYIQTNQLTSDSRVESYVIAFRSGCRCVELDVWDGDKEPEIFHGLGGFTMTSKILFRDVIEVVEKFAFETSEYPVILSIENHCSVEQQTMMARIMRSTLGDLLLTEELPDDWTKLPSPEQLKRKVIVKSKKISKHGEVNFDMEELLGNLEEVAAAKNMDVEVLKQKTLDDFKDNEDDHSHDLSQELSDCIVICRATGFKGFEEAAKNSYAEMSSFSEGKALKLIDKDLEGYVRHNQHQLSRIYPAGSRTGSSNYDPVPMWLAGCQIVALNIQTPDIPMHVNKGLFEDNGRCGFVLKPEFLTSATPPCTPRGPYPKEWLRTLKVKVIEGYQLPKKEGDDIKSILDPYIKISVIGVPDDLKEFQTAVVNDNGLNPEWNEEFEFTINCTPFAFVYFQVWDYSQTSSDELVAQYCLPFNCVRDGYRMINLKSPTGESESGQMLVQIRIT